MVFKSKGRPDRPLTRFEVCDELREALESTSLTNTAVVCQDTLRAALTLLGGSRDAEEQKDIPASS